jgi:hypothetical protein
VQNAARNSESNASVPAAGRSSASAKKAKLSVLLITRDDALWPQIGPHVVGELILKQLDSIDELIASTPSQQPAIVLWDAREQADAPAMLSRLQLHSSRFAVVVLDEAGGAHAWTNPIALRQVVAHVAVPVQAEELTAAVASAHEGGSVARGIAGRVRRLRARHVLQLANNSMDPGSHHRGSARRRSHRVLRLRHGDATVNEATPTGAAPAPVASDKTPAASNTPTPAAPPTASPATPDEKVDLLIEKARQAMVDRHFIDPAEGSALALYRSALQISPDNGEARQGCCASQRSCSRACSRPWTSASSDVALQALESARSINPSDARLKPLDERIAALRAELGPAQILATINAQNSSARNN